MIGAYKRFGAVEGLRQFLRALDFLEAHHFAQRTLRDRSPTFVEFGPGPTPLRRLKAFLFRRVVLIDRDDYNGALTGSDFLRLDLESGEFAEIERLLSASPGTALVWADHCFEHVAPALFAELLDRLIEQRCDIVFRVPNVESATGARNYARDATHANPFDGEYRRELAERGFQIIPWIRFYRPERWKRRAAPAMQVAEEVMFIRARDVRS